MTASVRAAVLAAAFASALPGCRATAPEPERPVAVPESWDVVCLWLRGQAEVLADDLESSRTALLARAEEEDPTLVPRLEGPPPTDRPPGWGVLPERRDDGPFTTQTPRERSYALRGISVNFVSAFRDGRILADRTARRQEANLESAVQDYERLSKDLTNLVDHLSYHEHWQAQVLTSEAFYVDRNEIVAAVREMTELSASDGDPDRIAALREQVREGTSRIDVAKGLAIEHAGDGSLVLPVTVHTDVDDAEFREVFLTAIDEAWNKAEASLSRRFTLRVDFEVHAVDDLYPEDAPEKGDAIVLDDHVARFPPDGLVMTTGAASTHAWKGRSLLLGPAPITPRTLAHEFGHLLGFDDGYVRGFDGDPDDAFGVVFVEWTGLRNDLMANSRGGRVTEGLIDRLVETYDTAGETATDDG